MSSTLKNGTRVPDSGSVNWDADVNSNWSLLDGALEAISKKITKEELATVATSGSYNDLSDKPVIPDTTSFYTKTETDGLLATKTNDSDLSAVAKSGSYTDLINKPDIPDTSNFYTKVQTDELLISKANSSEVYTKTETDGLLATKTNDSDLSAVAKSGSYTDLINKPDIPDTSNFYTKVQTDELLISKANSSEVYTKTEVDNLLSNISVNSITNEKIEEICVL